VIELLLPEDVEVTISNLPVEATLAAIPAGRFARFAKAPVRKLISGKLKRSPSYAEELADETLETIFKLARGKGPKDKKAKQMKKLVLEAARLQGKKGGPK